jgi:hypothetical protein
MTARANKPAPRVALKPRQIRERYNIPPSSLHFYCTKLEPAVDRLPSFLLPGRTGKKDTRLVYEHELLTWLEKYRVKHSAA